VISFVESTTREIEVSDETLALDEIIEVGQRTGHSLFPLNRSGGAVLLCPRQRRHIPAGAGSGPD
jgi:hypothetical protein